MVEPGDLWTTRLPRRLRDRALKFERDRVNDLVKVTIQGAAAEASGNPFASKFAVTTYHDQKWIPEEVDNPAEAMLTDMDADGVWATVLHPNFASLNCYVADHELALAHAQV